MKKVLLCIVCLLVGTFSGYCQNEEKSFTLEFKTGKVDDTQLSTNVSLDNVLEASSLEYVSGYEVIGTVTPVARTYYATTKGLLLGSTSNPGWVTLSLSHSNYIITKVEIEWAAYNNNNDPWIEISVNGKSIGKTSSTTNDGLHFNTITVNTVNTDDNTEDNADVNEGASSIKIASGGGNPKKARAYVKSLTVFYEEGEPEVVNPIFGNVPDKIILGVGEEIDYPEIDPTDLTYSFSVEPADLLTFDDTNKTIKANRVGAGIITFTTDAVEGEYNAASGTIDVEVSAKIPQMSFDNEQVTGKLGVGVVWQTVKITEPEGILGNDEKVSYSSSDPDIVTVNAENGRILPSDVKKAGEAVITATLSAHGDYAEASASYIILIKDVQGAITSGESVFDFTVRDAYGMTTITIPNPEESLDKDYEENINEIKSDDGIVSLNISGGKYRLLVSNEDTYSLYLYKPVDFKISVSEGYRLTKITADGRIEGRLDAEQIKLNGNNLKIWESDETHAQSFVTLEVSNTNMIKKLIVEYEAVSSIIQPAPLSFNKNVYGLMVNEAMAINPADHPEGVNVSYQIEGLDPEDYSIEEDEGDLTVRVDRTGSYTLTASSEADNEYSEGFAILRLNVFPPITVYANNGEVTSDVITAKEAITITLDVPAMTYAYYKLEDSSVKTKEAEAETSDENKREGYTLYENSINIPKDFKGKLTYYMGNYGYLSPERSLTLDVQSDVIEIEDGDGIIHHYDLNGREIKGELEKGVYIRVEGNHSSKVLVK